MAMADSLKVKITSGSINVELEGSSDVVIEQLNELRRSGLGNIFDSEAGKVKGSSSTIDGAAPKKRGRKPKNPSTVTPVDGDQPKRKRGRPRLKPLDGEDVNDPQAVALRRAARQERKAQKEAAKQEKLLAKEEARRLKQEEKERKSKLKKAKSKKKTKVAPSKSVKNEPDIDINLVRNQPMPDLQSIVDKALPGPEKEWIVTYSLFASEFGKRSFTRDEIMELYQSTGRRDQSKINNLTNNIKICIIKKWLDSPSDKKLYITEEGLKYGYKIILRESPIVQTKLGRKPRRVVQASQKKKKVSVLLQEKNAIDAEIKANLEETK